jgi:hypothetical protein
MPLQKLRLSPGIKREGTSSSNEGSWFDMDKVRFRSGYPEKLGGWVADRGQNQGLLAPPVGQYWGVARSLFNWQTLKGNNLLGVGTHLKFYVQNTTDGPYYDVTPIRYTSNVAMDAFTTVAGSMTVTVNDPGHGAETGDFVTISGVAGAVNGIPALALNTEFRITRLTGSTYTIEVSAPATSAGTAGAADFEYQEPVGFDIFTTQLGWGAGGWGGVTGSSPPTGWGQAATTGAGVGVQMRLWSQANFGEFLISNYRGGPLHLWVPAQTPNTFYRAQTLSPTNANTQDSVAYWQTDVDCPTKANFVMTSDVSRFVIAFGCNDYGQTTQDALLIRWSDQEDYTKWTPAATNQAGSFRLSQGSEIITAQQTRQEILVWTDSSMYSMQYLGPPYVWGLQPLETNISIASPNCVATATNMTFWMGVDKFYMYTGRVQTLRCDVRQYIFGDLNFDQRFQICAGTNERYNEVWWFYCSANSTVVDRYVIYNYQEDTWMYGKLGRTAWLDTSLRQHPMAAGYDGQILYHENGVDDGSVNPPVPIESYVQSADLDIGDGHDFGFVWRIIPDLTFDGSTVNNPQVNFTVLPRTAPGAQFSESDSPTVTSDQNFQNQRNYVVQQFTPIIYSRVRGRQMAFRVSSNGLGVQWQLGVPALDIKPDGKR